MVLPLGDLEKTQIVPVATYALIALNVIMFVVQLNQGDTFTISYAATPFEITHNVDLAQPISVARPEAIRVMAHAPVPFPVWLTVFTAMFLHGSVLHLAGNMLSLWIFGDNVEEVLGSLRYVIVYVTGGLIGTAAQIAANPDSLIPTLGASGAIAGVMGAYVVWFPRNRVRVLVFPYVLQMPALLWVGGWIVIQLMESFGTLGIHSQSGGVAYLAHVGGAALGIAVAWHYRARARYIHDRNEAESGWFEGPEDGPDPV